MICFHAVDVGLLFAVTPVHGPPSAQPVPHWVVLLAVVPALWLCLGGAVVVVDRLLESIENEPEP